MGNLGKADFDRAAWLASLAVGDEVGTHATLHTVVARDGRAITLSSGWKVNPRDGREMGPASKFRMYQRRQIEPPEGAYRKIAVDKLDGLRGERYVCPWPGISTKVLQEVAERLAAAKSL